MPSGGGAQVPFAWHSMSNSLSVVSSSIVEVPEQVTVKRLATGAVPHSEMAVSLTMVEGRGVFTVPGVNVITSAS